jgi:benzoylformate decarboxylase
MEDEVATVRVSDAISGARAALEVLAASGVDVVFGNPGTTEIPIIKEIEGGDSPVRYVLTLHEGNAVAAAMGYALATGTPGVALLHAMPGLANGLSQYFNAMHSGIPLVLIVGQQDRRQQYLNPILQAEMADVMRSVSKSVWEARTAAELPDVVAQALVTAATPPTGPAFLSVPVDLWDEPVARAGVRPARWRSRVGVAPEADVGAISGLIASAASPLFVAGDLIGSRGCGPELAALAELAAARAYWMPGSAMANFPTTSPFHRGPIFPNGASFERTFGEADVVVFAGAELQAPILFAGTRLIPEHCTVAAITETPADSLGALIPDLLAHGDIKRTLAAITDALRDALAGSEAEATTDRRREHLIADGRAARDRLRSRSLAAASSTPLTGRGAVATILDAAPERVAVIDESVSNSWVSLLGDFPDPASYLAPARGGSLGHALGVAIGAQIADPDRPTLAVVGDGSLIYGVQGLWTIAHEQLPIVTCVLNNNGYAILKDFFVSEHFNPELTHGSTPTVEMSRLSIESPTIDVVSLATSFGISAVRVEDAAACRTAVTRAFRSGQPWLIDVAVEHKAKRR